MDNEPSQRWGDSPRRRPRYVLERAEGLAELFERNARTLETSAALAEQHAQRTERQGRADLTRTERAAAKRASQAAERARAEAEELLELSRRPPPAEPPAPEPPPG